MVYVQGTAVAGAKAQLETYKQQLSEQQASIESAKQEAISQQQKVAQQVKQARAVGQTYAERQAMGGGLATMRTLGQRQKAIKGFETETGRMFIQQQEAIKTAEKGYGENVTAVSQYEQEVQAASDYQDAVKRVERAYEKGMLWAVSAYGSGLDKQLARQMIKEGYSPAKGGELEVEQYQQRKDLITDIRAGKVKGVDIKGSTIFSEGKPITLQEVGKLQVKQSLPAGEVPVFKGGELVGIESQALGKTVSLKEYNRIAEQQAKELATGVSTSPTPEQIKNAWFGGQPIIQTQPETFMEFTATQGLVPGTLEYVSGKISKIPAVKEIGATSLFSVMSVFQPELARKENAKALATAVQPASEFGIKTVAGGSPYFIPGVGEALLIVGGAEKAFRATDIKGKILGLGEAGLGLLSGGLRLKSFKQASDVKSAKTTFYAVEKAEPTVAASTIKVISKTRVGKVPYYGFTKQVVFDKTIPGIGAVKIGSTEGAVIRSAKRLYPIDIVTPRVQPIKDIFVTKTLGQAKKVSNILTVQPRQQLLQAQLMRISKQQGEGVIAAARIKRIEGGYSKALTAGGYKPVAGQEGTFTFVGGDAPRKVLTKEGFVIRTRENISGLVKQKLEKPITIGEGTGIITIQKGKTQEEILTFFHGTTEKSLPRILSEGLKPSAVTGISRGIETKPFVSTASKLEEVKGFAVGAAIKAKSKPVFLEINIPAKEAEALRFKSTALTGLQQEGRFLEIPSKYIKVVGEKPLLPKATLEPVTQQIVAEAVATQRAKALDIARSKIISPKPIVGLPLSKQRIQLFKTAQAPKILEATTPKISPVSSTSIAIKDATTLRTIPNVATITLTETKTQVTPITQLAIQSATRQTTRQGSIFRTPTITKTPLSFVDDEFGPRKKKTGISLPSRTLFKIFSKRRGRYFQIGTATSEAQAAKSLRGYLTRTLARSGFVTKDSQRVNLNLGQGFRKAKREAGVSVQIKALSRGTGEVPEILSFKRSKARGGRRLKWTL